MQHPVTNEYHLARRHVEETLKAVKALNLPTFWFWPNVDAGSDGTSSGIRAFREIQSPTNIRFFKNMEPNDFLRLLKNARCLIGNSSVGIRECAFLGVPVVNLGSRQNGRQRGKNVLDVPQYEAKAITEAILKQSEITGLAGENLYGDGDAGKRIADVLATVDLSFHKTITY